MLTSKILNIPLANRQGLTQEDVNVLEILHEEKDDIFRAAAMRRKRPDLCTGIGYKGMVLALQDIEFAMQRRWKFTQDRDYHTWWCKLPGCGCRNAIIEGKRARYIREDCEYHGTKEV